MNNYSANTCKYGRGNATLSVTVAVFYLIAGIAAFLSNVFIDYIIINISLHRVFSHMFILSLSVSSLIQGIVVSIVNATELMVSADTEFTRTHSWCCFSAGVSLLAIESTVYNILAISIDRAIAIFKPLRYHNIMRNVKIYIACLWLFLVIWCSLPLLGWALGSSCLRFPHATCDWGSVLDPNYFIITGTMVVASVIMVIVCQAALFRVSIRHLKKARANFPREGKAMNGVQAKVTRNVMLIALTFAVTYIPWFGLLIYNLKTGNTQQSYMIACNSLIYVNSFINPWVYAVTDRSIRTQMKRFLKRSANKVSPLFLGNRPLSTEF